MRTQRRRTQYLALGIVAAAALVLTGCTAGAPSTGSEADGDVTLTFLVSESPNLTPEYWDAAIARASKEVPGVTIKKVVGENTPAYAQQLFASGQAPDIFAAGIANGLAQKGELAEYTRAELEAAGITDFTSGTINGKFYGIPTGAQAIPLVYYNKDLFAKAGISAPPTTYAELVEDAAALKAAGIAPFEIGGGGEDTWATVLTLNSVVAADVLIEDPAWFLKREKDEVKFTDPEFVSSAAKVANLVKDGFSDPDGMTRTYADLEQAFLDGKAAMYPMGSWFTAAADSKNLSNIGVFGWPSDGGKPAFPVVTGAGMNVNANSENVDLAKKWALAFQTNTENLDSTVITDGAIVTVKGYTVPDGVGALYSQMVEAYNGAVDAGATVPAWGNVTGDGALPPGFNDKMVAANVDLMTGKTSPEDFAKYLDEQYAAAQK
ncbi:multiple sugar transport system substrate-binding protein [Microterricola gilva]|uniref:Multiple sugar transport system substrate-binding protein n=1 Tax=Microterricola gilva TaxID=393267 RepID=A0A4Q8AJI3_9MICO|nr:extracellular solute-binding protein [Microterricola gilva]RZU64033.1 multiple sugar transport system substrate-binding protein [Microterricola gilva]